MKLTIKELLKIIKEQKRLLEIASECDEGVDVFGIHNNALVDVLGESERVLKL